MTCIDHHEISSLLHFMIPIASILPHPIFLVAPSLSSRFTPYLLHQPQSIPQSFVPTLGAYPSHKQCLHIPCPSCGRLYSRSKFNISLSVMHCTQVVISFFWGANAFSITIFSSPWTWIASLNIIDVFHLCLPNPCSYHHIRYALCVEVQHVLHIPLAQLVVNPFNIVV